MEPEIRGFIPYETLMGMHKLYLDGKHKVLNQHVAKQETRSIWFKKDAALIEFLLGVLMDNKVSGIRIYLCDYPEEPTEIGGVLVPQNDQYVRQLTVGMVTTKENGPIQEDYPDPLEFERIFNTKDTRPQNHGTLCPPDDICP